MTPKLSIIMVNYRSEDVLEHCLRSIHVATKQNVEVLLIDNSPVSSDYQPIGGRSAGAILQDSGLPGLYFPQSENIDYTKAANFGARHATGEYLCFLNPDTILGAHALDRMIEWVEQHPRTVTGPRELNTNDEIVTTAFPFVSRRYLWGANLLYKIPWPRSWHSALPWIIPSYRYAWICRRAVAPTRVPVLSGSCLLMSRSVWETVGDWHEVLTYFGLESEWFMRAAELGISAWYLPQATIHHEHAVSINRADHGRVRDAAEANRRWYATRFGILTVAVLVVMLWIEHRLRPGRDA